MKGWILAAWTTFPAAAGANEPFDFTRVTQPALLGTGEVTGAVGTELQRPISEYERTSGGGGGGGGTGLGGRSAYEGVQHRAYAYGGLAPWLVLGAEQNLRQTDVDAFEIGMLAPEIRFVWNGIPALRDMPVTLSTFGGARLRLGAGHRRGSSAVAGMGLDHDFGRWVLATSLAFEKSVDGELDDRGLRYGQAIGLRFAKVWTAAMEAWGNLVWTSGAPFQHDHHLGPSLRWAFAEQAWLSSNLAGAIRERPNRGFTDWTWMLQIGVAF